MRFAQLSSTASAELFKVEIGCPLLLLQFRELSYVNLLPVENRPMEDALVKNIHQFGIITT